MSSRVNREIEECVRKNIVFGRLPIHLKQVMNNAAREYDRYVFNYSLKNQLRFRGNLVRQLFRNEKRYYELLVDKSVQCLCLFPYHLADIITKGLRVTPFNYYIQMLSYILRTDKSYDTLPNFTAIDCLRVLGIGRNEYLSLVAELKTNSSKLFRRPNPVNYLPKFPIEINIENWWKVEVGFVLESDIKIVNDNERSLIDDLIDFGSQFAGQRDCDVIQSLYRKGLIYLDVPISGEDKICIPPLKNFVMNRVSGDYFENLLYKIFVSVDEYTTIGELSQMLQIELDTVKHAVSLFCRLGFAQKKTEFVVPNCHPSWELKKNRLNVEKPQVTPLNYHALLLNETNDGFMEDVLKTPSIENSPDKQCSNSGNTSSDNQSDFSFIEKKSFEATDAIPKSPKSNGKRIAFLFDSTLTAFLMMGNLSPGLKNHAVTMFEVGKLSNECLDTFLGELEKVSLLDAEGEGEVSRYFAHAVILRSTIIALRGVAESGLDLLRLECLDGLDRNTRDRLLSTKYKCIVSAAPLTSSFSNSLPIPFFGQFYKTCDNSNFWLKLFYYHFSGFGPPSLLLTKGTVLKNLPRVFLGYGNLLVTIVHTDSYVLNTNNFKSINKQLKNSSVLIQAYGIKTPGEVCYESFPFDANSTFSNHKGIRKLSSHLNFSNTCGYVTFLKTGVKDIGCEDEDINVHLKRPERRKSIKSQKITEPLKAPIGELMSPCDDIEISSFKAANFKSPPTAVLKTPNEEHFANSPNSTSPANIYRSEDCNELLESELDKLSLDQEENKRRFSELVSQSSIEIPLESSPSHITEYEGDDWTVLDVHFGVPLFDVDCNTRICQQLVKNLLLDENLIQLMELNKNMNDKFMKFVSQCLYFEDEEIGLIKIGKLIPQPRINLVFDNGKVNYWNGK